MNLIRPFENAGNHFDWQLGFHPKAVTSLEGGVVIGASDVLRDTGFFIHSRHRDSAAGVQEKTAPCST